MKKNTQLCKCINELGSKLPPNYKVNPEVWEINMAKNAKNKLERFRYEKSLLAAQLTNSFQELKNLIDDKDLLINLGKEMAVIENKANNMFNLLVQEYKDLLDDEITCYRFWEQCNSVEK